MNRLLFAISFIVSATLTANAQNSEQNTLLEEVVVNGCTKSTQTIDKQGVSYTLLDSALLTKNNIREITDIPLYTPGIEIPNYGSRMTSAMYVRGVGSRINSPSVGVYYENIPLLFKTAMNRHYYGISKAAVLRGPQGTLYGQNSEGGLLVLDGKSILPLSKLDSPRTTAHLGISNHFGRQLELGHIFDINDKMALSVDLFYKGTDGFTYNSALDCKADNADEAGAKVKFEWQAKDNLFLSLFADFQTTDEKGFTYGEVKGATDGEIRQDSTMNPSTNVLSSYRRNLFDAGLNIIYFKGKWRMQSTTSFQYINDDMEMDQDYTAQNFMRLTQHQRGKAITEEFNIKGNLADKWSTSTGVFAAQQWLTTIAPIYFEDAFTNRMETSIWAMMKAANPRFAAITINPLSMKMDVPGEFRTPMTNLGIFHESNFAITKDFNITLGLRYDFNLQKIDYNTALKTNVGISLMNLDRNISSIYNNKISHSFNQLLPKLSIRYKDWYATVSKGYRAGGYNIQMFSDILQGEFSTGMRTMLPQLMQGDVEVPHDDAAYAAVEDRIDYDPEVSWNYEIGGTSTLTSNSKATVKAHYAVFYSQVKDLQLSVMADTYGFGRMMKNAGDSKSYGGEISLEGVHQLCAENASSLTWGANYSYTYTKFLEDKRVPFFPSHIVNARIAYNWSRYSVELNMNGRGRIYWDEENTLSQPFYTQFGARAGANFGRVTFGLWARNLLDYRPSTFAFSSSVTGQNKTFSQKGEPFMVGVDINLGL